MSCQQKTACITLVFSSFYPALAESQSQKSQIWRVPVVSPEMNRKGSESDAEPLLSPAPSRSIFFESLMMEESDTRISAHSAQLGSSKISKSEGIRAALRAAGVSVLGSETSGAENGRLTLRASPGQAPVFYVDGVPLSSGFSGSSPETLIPTLAIEQIQVFPFVSQSGMPRRSNSGSLNLQLRLGGATRRSELNVSVADPRETLFSQYYSPSCRPESFLGCLSSSWQLGTRAGTQNVKDDNNTPLIGADDTVRPLHHNSGAKWGGHFKLHKVAPLGGAYETTAVFGGQNKGLNGLPVSSASPLNRLRSSYTLLSHSGFLFSPVTGNILNYGLSGRNENSSFASKVNAGVEGQRTDERSERMFLGRFGLSHPLDGPTRPRVFASGAFEHNAFESRLNVTTLQRTPDQPRLSESVSKGILESLDFGGGLELSLLNQTLLRAEIFFQWAQMSQRSECGVFAPRVLCESQSGALSRISPGGAVEIQRKLSKSFIMYGLVGRSVRLPRPLELMGRPDGIIANRALQPESSDFFEVGMQTPFIHSGAFYGRDRNLITLAQVSPYLAQFDNRPRVRRVGFFSSGEARLGSVSAELSYERAWVTSDGRSGERRPVPFVPSSQASGQFSYLHTASLWGLDAPRASLGMSRSGDYFLDRDSTYLLLPPIQVGFLLSGELRIQDSVLNIDLSIRNLLDNKTSLLRKSGERQTQVGWSYLPSLPLAGRSVILALNLKSS